MRWSAPNIAHRDIIKIKNTLVTIESFCLSVVRSSKNSVCTIRLGAFIIFVFLVDVLFVFEGINQYTLFCCCKIKLPEFSINFSSPESRIIFVSNMYSQAIRYFETNLYFHFSSVLHLSIFSQALYISIVDQTGAFHDILSPSYFSVRKF